MANPIPEGYELLSGHGRDNARAALKVAQDRGLSTATVLRVRDGYLIPLGDDDPYKGLTVAELKDLAATREVDLGDATKKDDILAALRAADSKGE
jgi:hypothetical protein